MPHHVHVAGAGFLQIHQLARGRPALAHDAIESAVFRFGDQRHDIMQKRALGLDDAADFRQMLVVDAGYHDRVDLHQNAACD